MAQDAQLIAYRKLVEALPGLLDDQGRRSLCDWLAERRLTPPLAYEQLVDRDFLARDK